VEQLTGPLKAEARAGYRDSAVLGQSIAQYARAWAKRAKEALPTPAARRQGAAVSRLLAGYETLSPEQREERVTTALKRLETLVEGECHHPKRRDTGASRSRPARQAGRRSSSAGPPDVPEHAFMDRPLTFPDRVAGKWMGKLEALGIASNRDLLYHLPRDYVPLRRLAELRDGERAAVLVVAGERETLVIPRGPRIRLMRCSLVVSDDSGEALVTSFVRLPRAGARSHAIRNSPLALNYPPDSRLLIEGVARRSMGVTEISYLSSERLGDEEQLPRGGLVPVYPLTEGVYQSQLRPTARRLLAQLPAELEDPLPPPLRKGHGLESLPRALRDVHFPPSEAARDAARRRLVFEELLVLQLAMAQRKRESQAAGGGVAMPPKGDPVALLEGVLSFRLTRAQQRVIAEIAGDMASDRAMCRLLQGDVGAGKTVVAAAALLIAGQNGFQGALMAPTEILAEQHYGVLTGMLSPLGVNVVLLTGSMRRQDRERALEQLRKGGSTVVVGTHALIQSGVEFRRLGLVIVDEQHRFGVRQRAQLVTKGARPDLLVMTATPIPRTLALTAYGDLDISVLDESPGGPRRVHTECYPRRRTRWVFSFLREQVSQGGQAYVICPLIEESETLQAEAATRLAARLQEEEFADLQVGLLHGAMSLTDRNAVMEAFRAGEIDVLVATTVIEVGVDVANATTMVILNAERFGLSQLHQLRGRVGRKGREAHCLLVTESRYDPSGDQTEGEDDPAALARQRLAVIKDTCDGFAIAEHDLRLRGPGEYFGTRQHGLPELRLAQLASDPEVLLEARSAAFGLIADDPELVADEHRLLRGGVATLRSRIDNLPG
jgi:ATP-dependent DNA helicase RecG